MRHNLLSIQLIFFLFFFIIPGCQNATYPLDGIELDAWREDDFGCKNYRLATLDTLKNQKNKLLRFSEHEIIQTLGFADKAELIQKSEKYYFYYFSGHPECSTQNLNKTTYLRIRFNSMGFCKETLILNDL